MRKTLNYIVCFVSCIILAFISVSEIISVTINPTVYNFGSESMMACGGMIYNSKYTYIATVLLISIFSMIVFIVVLKNKARLWINFSCLVLGYCYCLPLKYYSLFSFLRRDSRHKLQISLYSASRCSKRMFSAYNKSPFHKLETTV